MESLPSAAANWGAASHIGDSNVAGFPDIHDQIIANDGAGDRDRPIAVPKNYAPRSSVGFGLLENGHGKESL